MPKLHTHIGVPAYSGRVLPALATIALLLVVAGVNAPIFHPPAPAPVAVAAVSGMPVLLSASDAATYREAFASQRAGRIDDADTVASKTQDPLLRGVLLGERYLAPGHEPSFSEVALWLSRYGDYAQAGDIYRVARERTPENAEFLTEPQTVAALKSFERTQDRSALSGEKHWISGLAAFRRHDMKTAAAHFKALATPENDNLAFEDRAAVAFWAYRAANASGDATGATRYINMAAEESPCFYSIIAREIRGQRAQQSPETNAASAAAFMEKGAVRRAIELKQIGQDALAEKELRSLFPGSTGDDRKRLVQLARTLQLPGAQMRMAVAAAYDASASDTMYPLPRWTPTLGFHVEPALLFAIMRQESGFNPNAVSSSGAMGVMQLMPATAHAMAQDARLQMSAGPAMSMTLGQHYLERLMGISAINDNMVYLLAAYNAGPGSVMNWQKNGHDAEDPLLFIESMPFAQTRDYVQSVMGNYWVYSEMLGNSDNHSVMALAANRWPHYERSHAQTVQMVSRLNIGSGGTE